MHNIKWMQWLIAAMVAVLITACGGGADTTAPVITLNGSATMSVAQGATFTDPGATAVDDVDGNVTVSVSGSVDTSTVGTYTLTYSATDKAGNTATKTRTVTVTAVADTTNPVVTLTGDSNIYVVQFETFTDPGATATDDVDGNVSVTVSGTVDTDTPGTYTLTYTATDSAGNSASTTRTVTVTVFSVMHNGYTYYAVKSPYTGEIFLDRNLGAARACTALDDAACYGDYYQWGRKSDGHEDQNSGTTSTQAGDVDDVTHDNFITSSSSPYDWAAGGVDDNGNKRIANWLKTDGTFVCPTGFRVPTEDEMKAELFNPGSAEIQKDSSQKADNDDNRRVNAYNSFLKLPSAGFRRYSDGTMMMVGGWGGLWTNTASPQKAKELYYTSGAAGTFTWHRTRGLPVRCIKD